MKKSKKKVSKKSSVKAKAPTRVVPIKNSFGAIPLGDRVLVRPMPPETMTASGIIIPDTAKEKPEQGTVVAVGPGKVADDGTRIPLSVKVGDTVLFSKYGYDEVKIKGTEYYVVREDSIALILE